MLCSTGTESHALVSVGKRGPWRRQRSHASSWRPPWLRAREAPEMAFSGNDLRHGGAFRFALASMPFPWFDDHDAQRILAALTRGRAAHALELERALRFRVLRRSLTGTARRPANSWVEGARAALLCPRHLGWRVRIAS